MRHRRRTPQRARIEREAQVARGPRVYYTVSRANTLAVIDLRTLTVVGEVPGLVDRDGMAWYDRRLPSRRRYLYASKESGDSMSIARTSEITATSTKSFADAVETGLKRASKTLRGISGAWIADQEVTVKNGKIETYKVRMRVTFVLDS
jgi:flavin-binding protein dodecin